MFYLAFVTIVFILKCNLIARHGGHALISTLWRLRQEDREFEDALGYKVRPCLKKRTKTKRNKKCSLLKIFGKHVLKWLLIKAQFYWEIICPLHID
jgi:hypothetical protein